MDKVRRVAVLVVMLVKRSKLNRVRISNKTVEELMKIVDPTVRLTSSFVVRLQNELSDFGLSLVELRRGGFAAITHESLEGAKEIPLQAAIDLFKANQK